MTSIISGTLLKTSVTCRIGALRSTGHQCDARRRRSAVTPDVRRVGLELFDYGTARSGGSTPARRLALRRDTPSFLTRSHQELSIVGVARRMCRSIVAVTRTTSTSSRQLVFGRSASSMRLASSSSPRFPWCHPRNRHLPDSISRTSQYGHDVLTHQSFTFKSDRSCVDNVRHSIDHRIRTFSTRAQHPGDVVRSPRTERSWRMHTDRTSFTAISRTDPLTS